MTAEQENWISNLYRANFKRLCRAAYRLTGSMEIGEELVQDTFLLALTNMETLRSHPNPEAWLLRTLSNLCSNERRKASKSDVSLDALFETPAAQDDQGILELLPEKLPEDDRRILIWRFEKRLDYTEIANRLGITETACRSRIFRAVEKCRKLLSESG